MPKVFVSHSTSDRDFVENEIVSLLHEHGIETWYSKTDIGAAANWEQKIRTALDGCDWFLVVMSSSSLASEWVQAEIHWAMEERKGKIVPVMLEPCDPSAFHLMLRKIQFVDFSGDLQEARRRLLAVWSIAGGETYTERFVEDRVLGKGGMGEVWLARDQSLNRQVAIKRIRSEILGKPEAEKRFFQEARDAAALNHLNIVSILHTDRDERGPYLVLEYMDGGSLRQKLDESGKMDPLEALAILRQMLQALEHAHENGIIHRDIKPENILLTRSGIPKLSDFGLAWAMDDEIQVSPHEGTRPYLAPELKHGDTPNVRTDLYSLGVTFYEMMTGRDPQPIQEKKVPSTLSPLLRKLTAENPGVRYTSATSALQECRDLERAMELEGRSDEETAARMRKTVVQGYTHCAAHNLVDAQACFERVLAEDPDHPGALSGSLLALLMKGEMDKSATLLGRLRATDAEDPVFAALRSFFDSIRSPLTLTTKPAPLSYSYEVESLQTGRLTKELVEVDKKTVNLGDIGELLVEITGKKNGSVALTHADAGAGRFHFRFTLDDNTTVDASYELKIDRGSLFRSAKLEAMAATLEVNATGFECYRLARYLTRNLVQRFKRDSTDAIAESRHLECDFTKIAEDACRRPV